MYVKFTETHNLEAFLNQFQYTLLGIWFFIFFNLCVNFLESVRIEVKKMSEKLF